MTKASIKIREELAELNPEALFVDGMDDALVGIVRQFNRYLPLYDYDKCVDILAEGMPGEDEDIRNEQAMEYMEFNVVGSWVGANTPVFVLPSDSLNA